MANRRNMGGEGCNELGWRDNVDTGVPMDMFGRPRFGGNFRNKRYSDAYGDYSGGYGPPGPSGPRGVPPFGFGPGPGPDFWSGPPPFVMGRGFGPGGPPQRRFTHDDKAIKYLIRCGVAKEHLKNLPKDLLQFIEPNYCGLCAQSFDSFAHSRMHYISKNHLKNQKRWLSHKPELGFQQNEVPFRSRDLYCELCDVQITSKTHAESHYAGKPHRAIVEGRKNPKNPMLLQNNMRGRLEQLIRREKKHLKALIETEQSEEKVEQDKKPVSSDLFCDICKTSVTCTEQMTMHLNGKKHLTKEKQHILNMMKYKETDVVDEINEIINTYSEVDEIPRRDRIIKPWLTPGMVRCMRNRDRLHKCVKKDPNNAELKLKYTKYRNYCNSLLRKLKFEYEKSELLKNEEQNQNEDSNGTEIKQETALENAEVPADDQNQEEIEADNFDWGNGSAAWDEPVKEE